MLLKIIQSLCYFKLRIVNLIIICELSLRVLAILASDACSQPIRSNSQFPKATFTSMFQLFLLYNKVHSVIRLGQLSSYFLCTTSSYISVPPQTVATDGFKNININSCLLYTSRCV